jgi:hypothetical protein
MYLLGLGGRIEAMDHFLLKLLMCKDGLVDQGHIVTVLVVVME